LNALGRHLVVQLIKTSVKLDLSHLQVY
jgi:hypothetical protein